MLAANQAFLGGADGTGGHIKGTKRKMGAKVRVNYVCLL